MNISVQDRLDILELTARYNHAIDHHAPEAWADLFTAGGVLKSGDDVKAFGREQLVDFAKRVAAQGRKARHWVNNLVIEGDSSSAALKMYFCAYDLASEGQQLFPYVMGEYEDQVVKTSAGWKFKVRDLRIVGGRSKLFKSNN